MLSIPSFTLNTQPGNIYNITLSFTYEFTDSSNKPYDFKQITGFTAGVFCNLSQENQNIYANPTTPLPPNVNNAVTSQPSSIPFTSGSFVKI